MSNTEIIHTIQGLRLLLETLEAQLAGGKAAPVSKAPAAEKPKRGASDALKAWNAEVDKVKAEMIADGWTHPETGKPVTRKDAMQEASRRRAADPDAPKPKPKPKAAAESTSDAEEKPKPKRVLSDEQKAKMAAGRKAAAERRKAEKAAEAAATAAPEPKKVSFAHPPLPPSDDEEQEEDEHLTPIAVKTRKYLMNPEHGTCWKRNADGSKGEYAGVYDAETKTIDDSIPEEFFE